MNAVLVALIVAFAGVAGPLFLSYLNNRQRHAERAEDYARQDAVAAKAAEAAELLLESNKAVAATAKVTNNKLDVIHTLVNSTLTAAIEAQLEATVQQLEWMRHVVALSTNGEPSRDAIVAIESKIAELRVALKDRRET